MTTTKDMKVTNMSDDEKDRHHVNHNKVKVAPIGEPDGKNY